MKILVITKNWLGDLLFQFPAIEALKCRWPEARITCLTPERCREIASYHPSIDEVIVFDERAGEKGLFAKLRFIRALRAKGPWDKAFLFHRSRTRAALAALAGARERTGYGSRRKWLLTRPVEEPQAPTHHVDYFLDLLEKSGIPAAGERLYRFEPRPEDAAKAALLLDSLKISPGSYACFHLGANWEPKRWPVARFAELAGLIHVRAGLSALITGSAQDAGLAEQMLALAGKARVISLAGKTPFGELAALFREAAFVVSGDSGPMHIASAAGARVIALFGPTDPKLTGPRGRGESVVIHHVPEGYTVPWTGEIPAEGWIGHIGAEQVLSAAEGKGWLERSRQKAKGSGV